MKGNLILIHGGGPTAVINASLAGAIRQAQKEPNVDRILAAIGGTGGLMQGHVRDLTDISEAELAMLERTPGSAIGTSRDALEEEDYRLLAQKCVEYGAKVVLMNGGNGTMDACGKLCRALAGTDIRVMGIPKTMDNDIAVTDHAPGFGSAARYIAQSVAEVTADVHGLPIHVVVIEASGRNAGWITAASALARQAGVDGPDLIYLPERPFDEEQYLADVKALIEKKRGVVVVASEGLKDKDGKPIVEPVFKVGRATYFGDVSAHLANLVIKHLGYKARSGAFGARIHSAILQGGQRRSDSRGRGSGSCGMRGGERQDGRLHSRKHVALSRPHHAHRRERCDAGGKEDAGRIHQRGGQRRHAGVYRLVRAADRRAAGEADFIKG